MLLLWILIVAGLGSFAGKLYGAENNVEASFLPTTAESTQVYQLQQDFNARDLTIATVVASRAGQLTAADHAAISAAAQRATGLHLTNAAVSPPMTSRDGVAAEFIVPISTAAKASVSDEIKNLRAAVQSNLPAGLQVNVTGPGGFLGDSTAVYKSIDGSLLGVTLLIVIVLLLLTYRSPILWLIPIIAVGMGLVLAQAVAYLLAVHAGMTVNGLSGSILLILVFGAGTDYALFIVARYREELRRHEDKHAAMAAAMRRVVPALIASAATVTLGMLCLLFSELNSNRGLGPVSAVGILSAFVVMTTLLPALLVIMPRGVFWPRVPKYGVPGHEESGVWYRVGHGVSRRPAAVWTLTIIVLAGLGLGLSTLKAHGLSFDQQFTGKPDSIVGEHVVDAHFSAGTGSPLIVVAKAGYTDQVEASIHKTPGVTGVTGPVTADGYAQYTVSSSAGGDTPAAYNTVDALRAEVHQVPGADAKVGGDTAVDLDTQRAAGHDRDRIIPIVLVVILVILMLLLRAIVAPLVLIATVALSFAASLGASSFVFDHAFHYAGADASMPLFVFIFLVALGVDYNIFLMTRVREETARLGPREGMIQGLGRTGGVITSAGFVLAATFAALTTIPLVNNVELGFAIALGVLLDTLVVRSVLVPAIGFSLGRGFWWPGRLSRRRRA